MVNAIEFKFGMYIRGHRQTNPTEFGEYWKNNFLTGVQKRILIHYGLWSQVHRRMLVSKRFIRFSSNLI